MAAAFVQTMRSFGDKTASATIVASFLTSTTSGNLIVAYILFDNAATASKPVVTSITKPGSETANWVFLGAARSTSTSAGAFSSGEMWCIKTTVAWPASAQTITLDTSVTMRGVQYQEFSGVEAALRSTAGTAYSTTTTAASATTTGTTPQVGDLALGFLFGSNVATIPASDTDTTGGSWSTAVGFGSTGGSAATNNYGLSQYKILTSANHQTFNSSAAMTAGNGVIVAILQASVVVLPKTATLTDTFDTTIDTSKWTNNGGTPIWDNGRAQVMSTTLYDTLQTGYAYDFTGSSYSARVIPAQPTTQYRETGMSAQNSTDDSVNLIISNGNLIFRVRENSTNNDSSIGYDAAKHPYLRIKLTGTTASAECSRDGSTWASTGHPTKTTTKNYAAVRLTLWAGMWGGTDPATPAWFDNVNTGTGLVKVSTLTDTFDTQIDPVNWWTVNDVVWDASGRVKLTSRIDTAYSRIYSQRPYDITESSVFAKMVVPTVAANGSREMNFMLASDTALSDRAMIILSSSGGAWTLMCRRATGGVNTSSSLTTYDATNHAWWRIRHTSGTLYFDTSPDSTTWTNLYSVASNSTVLTTSAIVVVEVGQWQTESDISSGYVDNVNVTARTGRPKIWTGSAMVNKPAKIWTGSSWVIKPYKTWDGSQWKLAK